MLKTENEVKKWIRGLPLLRKELSMRIEFFSDLARECKKSGTGIRHEGYYLNQIDTLHEQIKVLEKNVEYALDLLDPDERAVISARYIKNIMWDAMEFHIHYSRRQAIRIHDRALKRLAGAELKGGAADEKD